MKIRTILYIFLTGFMVFIVSCTTTSNEKDKDLAPNAHKVRAEEVIQTTNYTYVRVSSEDKEYWIAINKANVKEKETYYWSVGSEMNEFTSKELKRTFRSIFFVQDFTDQPITVAGIVPSKPTESMAGRQESPEYPGIVVPKAPGGITIAELYAGKDAMGGKKVRICGKVVKFSGGIMNKNWIHLQDGTKCNGKYDLALNTLETLKVGDVAIFEGTLSLNKDIGAGYVYEVLMEDAVVKK
jgi:hypothetical protein